MRLGTWFWLVIGAIVVGLVVLVLKRDSPSLPENESTTAKQATNKETAQSLMDRYYSLYRTMVQPIENALQDVNRRLSAGGYYGSALASLKAAQADLKEKLNTVAGAIAPLRMQARAIAS